MQQKTIAISEDEKSFTFGSWEQRLNVAYLDVKRYMMQINWIKLINRRKIALRIALRLQIIQKDAQIIYLFWRIFKSKDCSILTTFSLLIGWLKSSYSTQPYIDIIREKKMYTLGIRAETCYYKTVERSSYKYKLNEAMFFKYHTISNC